MTKRTITALFDEYGDAAKAVSQLKEAGIPEADISLLGGDKQARASSLVNNKDDDNDAGKGAAIGGAIGGGAGLLAGLGMLAIPGLGPVVAAGWLASTLVG
jgi:heat induced stress protein YflT